MTTDSDQAPAQIAVWYFVSATFAFAATSLYPDAPMWLRIVCMVVGFVLVVLGGIRLGTEITSRRAAPGSPPPADNDAH
ncbi:hypothetical protein [Agromyces silvae]|uniref:hypothetical protein n=1 Tax=Agromyces silvae TaxID=3388266 RepID=UPI00280A659A|nr:hypothetical protein [Agromyces protaetiae]